MNKKFEIIAEVKTHSPFGWTSNHTWDELFKVADKIGDIISIHTDSKWNGSFELLKKARKMTKKPILAKGIHGDDKLVQQAINAGADWVLVVGRIPKVHLDKCIIEPLSLQELKLIPSDFRVVWNSRDISDGMIKKETFAEARDTWKGWLCQASNIKSVDDINEEADAILVGTHLLDFSKSFK